MDKNMHGDHVATCLCCANLYVELGTPDYTDHTPGSPGEVKCLAGRFHFGYDCLSHTIIKKLHDNGQFCEYFKGTKTESGG